MRKELCGVVGVVIALSLIAVGVHVITRSSIPHDRLPAGVEPALLIQKEIERARMAPRAEPRPIPPEALRMPRFTSFRRDDHATRLAQQADPGARPTVLKERRAGRSLGALRPSERALR